MRRFVLKFQSFLPINFFFFFLFIIKKYQNKNKKKIAIVYKKNS